MSEKPVSEDELFRGYAPKITEFPAPTIQGIDLSHGDSITMAVSYIVEPGGEVRLLEASVIRVTHAGVEP